MAKADQDIVKRGGTEPLEERKCVEKIMVGGKGCHEAEGDAGEVGLSWER